MKLISLMPSEYKKLKRSAKKTGYMMIITGILSMVFIFAYAILKILSTIPESEIKVLRTEKDMLVKNIEALGYLSNLDKEFVALGVQAQKAVGNQPDWLNLFITIGSEAPDGLLINAIDAKNQEKACTFEIMGYALSHADVALWIKRLKTLEAVSDAELQYSKLVDNDERKKVAFEILLIVANDKPFKLFREDENENN